MPKKHNPGCPCCQKLPPSCACSAHDCFESYGNYSSVRVEVEFEQDDWNYYERIRTFFCGGFCNFRYRDIEVYREMSGFQQFNGTYDIGFYSFNSIDGATESTPSEDPCGWWFFPTLLGEMYRRTATIITYEYNCVAGSSQESVTNPTMRFDTHMGRIGWVDGGPSGTRDLSTWPYASEINFGLPIVWDDFTTFTGNTLFECEPEYGPEVYAETSRPVEVQASAGSIPTGFSNQESRMTGFLKPPFYESIPITIDDVPGRLVNATSGCIRNWGQTRAGLNAYSTSQSFAPTACSNFLRPAEYVLNWTAFSWKIKVSLNV
jgi:hypothetical protein